MRAVVAGKLGGPEVLSVTDFPDPEPAAGHVVVWVAAATAQQDLAARRTTGKLLLLP